MQYYSTLKAKLIYIFTIPDEAHKGCVKIGEATLDEATDSTLPPNCKALNQAAKSRVERLPHNLCLVTKQPHAASVWAVFLHGPCRV